MYSSKRILVPTPRFIVFYNGQDTFWDTKEMKLSDAFEQKTDCPDLELKLIRRDEREIGREEGLQKGIKCYILDNLEDHVPDERIIIKLQKIFGILPEEGRQLVSSYRQAK